MKPDIAESNGKDVGQRNGSQGYGGFVGILGFWGLLNSSK